MASILVIGGGGREHALVWKLSQSPHLSHIYVSPANAGISMEKKVTCIPALKLPPKLDQTLISFCCTHDVSLVVVGPEDPLANGIADLLAQYNIHCFGPCKLAAQIESSKVFSKHLMVSNGIATARFEQFSESSKAVAFLEECTWDARVVKVSGLAAGKGVVVAKNKKEAQNACVEFLENKKFGEASETIIVEEFLEGVEISALFFCDGCSVKEMPLSRDHKQLLEADKGPNTGGMGAVCPIENLDRKKNEIREIAIKTVQGLQNEGIKYIGVLYIGLMLTPQDQLNVLEYNCRFGDPETQSLMPLLETDLYKIIVACVEGNLNSMDIDWSPQYSCCVVLASGGYPLQFEKGSPIYGLDDMKTNKNFHVFHAGTKMENGVLVTNGGRVLSVVAVGSSLLQAQQEATQGAMNIHFKDVHFRKDIGLSTHKIIEQCKPNGLTYADAGVSIDTGNRLVQAIKPLCKNTRRPGFSRDIGGFGELFDVKAAGYDDALLVMGTDGVGTKLKLALQLNEHSTIGFDLVAMCVNDVLCLGAEPLAFLDYYACAKLDLNVAKDVITGITQACQMANCALVGGETAEMPGFYTNGKYDLAGFCVGAVERTQCILPNLNSIESGDVIIGIASSGLHSNGFSLVNKILERESIDVTNHKCPWDENLNFGTCLLTPTKIYVKSVLPIIRDGYVLAAAHITGGGLLENIPRVLPQGVMATIHCGSWEVPRIFQYLSNFVSPEEMTRTFNCGIGMVLIVKSENSEAVLHRLINANEKAVQIGVINKANHVDADAFVEFTNRDRLFNRVRGGIIIPSISNGVCKKVRVAVLISGSGTNLQALINHCESSKSLCEIKLVISNVQGVQGLQRAKNSNIKTIVQSHKGLKREDFDTKIDDYLEENGIDLVCLAGFMRILSEQFVKKWRGRLLNTHPSLLPSFKGGHAVRDALQAGVIITGCTVHFVEPEVDSGAIIAQAPVEVYANDTVNVLQERIKKQEHILYPIAMERVASKKVSMEERRVVY